MIEDFKKFINQGNVLDLAVGLVIGAAFAVIINAFVDGLLSPLIGLILPGMDNLNTAKFTISDSDFFYGPVIVAVISFVAIAATIFFIVVRPYNQWKERSAADADVEPTNEEKMVALLEQIAQQPR
ncbi:MAG: large conductance mechanosensitive channel protein MscL [Microthrixaceae bacterium]|nr:large conductance mechanosensitive channel protein MscL [Microthrixaceae bacterium]